MSIVENLPTRSGPEMPDVAAGQNRGIAAQPNPLLMAHSLLRGRYKLAICLAILGAAIGGPIGYFAVSPEYRSVGLIQFEPRGETLVFKTEGSGVMPLFESFMQSQVTNISNRRIVILAVQSPEWAELNRGFSEAELAKFEKNLQVTVQKGSPLVQVAFSDVDPNAATLGVKVVIDAFKKVHAEEEKQKNRDKQTELDSLEQNTQSELGQLIDRIHSMAGGFGAAALADVTRARLAKLAEVKSDLESVAVAIATISTSSAAPGASPTTQSADQALALLMYHDSRLEALKAKLEADESQLRQMASYADAHPVVQRLKLEIQSENELIRHREEELRTFSKAAPMAGVHPTEGLTLPQLKAKEQALKKQSSDLDAEVAELARRSRDIEKLQIERREKEATLEQTMQSARESRTERDKAGRLSDVIYGDRPLVPDKDRRKALSAVGALGTAGIGVGFVVMLGFFDRRLRHVDRARSHLPQVNRLLGVLPELPTALTDAEAKSESAFCVHHIRAMLQIHQRSSGKKVFAITSPAPGDGKTSLTITLGISLASSGCNTLMVDCDFDGGGLSSRVCGNGQNKSGPPSMPADRPPGLVDVLRGMPLEHAITSTGYPNLSILPLGAAPSEHVGLMSPGQLRRILIPLAARFDTVLVDCGPVLGSIEAAITATEVDGVILVVSRESDRVAADHAANLLISAGSTIEGIVFNRARPADVARSSYHSSSSVRSARSVRAPSDPIGVPTTDAEQTEL